MLRLYQIKNFSTRLTLVKKCWFLVKNQYIYLNIYPYNCNNEYFIIWNVIWWRFKCLFILQKLLSNEVQSYDIKNLEPV